MNILAGGVSADEKDRNTSMDRKMGKMYLEEENKLKAVFKDELIEIYHIGSTSIPSVGYAKPIIDILIVVKDIEKVNLFNDEMLCLGYEPRNEHGITGRRYFTKGKLKRSHHIHIFQLGNKNIDAHLSFKDYLNNNPEDAKKYGDLKKYWQSSFLMIRINIKKLKRSL